MYGFCILIFGPLAHFLFSNGNLVDFVCAIFYSTLNKAGGEGAEPGFLQCQNTLCSTTTLITKS